MVRVRSIYASTAICPGCSDQIAAEIEVSQRCALLQHSCKTLCSISADQIASDLQVSNAICPGCSDEIAVEIEVSRRCALRQHSCKTLCCIKTSMGAYRI